jgi:hypothetical protein
MLKLSIFQQNILKIFVDLTVIYILSRNDVFLKSLTADIYLLPFQE